MKIRNTLLLLFAFLYAAMAFAQDKEPPPPTKNNDDSPPVGLPLPIDDYIPLLIPVGLVLGIYLLGFSENIKREFPEDA